MLLSRVIVLIGALAVVPAQALVIKAPDIVENGAVISVEIVPASPLTSGQQLELRVNGQPAALLKVVAGKVTSFTTRVQSERNEAVISARVLADGREREQGARTVKVKVPEPASGAPTKVQLLKARTSAEFAKVLLNSKNGFAGTLVLQGAKVRVEVTGSGLLSRNPFIAINGEFAGQITVSIDAISLQVAESPPTPVATTPRGPAIPVTPARTSQDAPAPAPRVAVNPQQSAANAIGERYDQRIQAASEQCKSSMNSCETQCATQALMNVIGKTGNLTAHLDCTNNCNRDRDSCHEQAKGLEREKRQAIAAALAPPPPPAPAHSSSTSAGGSGSASAGGSAGKSEGSGGGLYSARVCDGQCAMIVSEVKCKHLRHDNLESLKCQMSHGIINPDTPELCAQAKALTGCRTKAEAEEEKKHEKFLAPSSYETVCDRNLTKIEKVIWEKKVNRSTATYDLVEFDLYRDAAAIYKPCIGMSADAARRYNQATKNYEDGKRYCAGPHKSYECTRWGYTGGGVGIAAGGVPFNNQEYYRVWKVEVDKALSDSNYSADLGTVGGRAFTKDKTETACRVALDDLIAQHKAAESKIPKDSIVVRSEATMWLLAKSSEVIKAKCPESRSYAAQLESDRKTYADIQRACDASASAPPCKPRLPGKEPVRAPQVASKPLPPLRDKPEPACGRPTTPNAVDCLKKQCAKEAGKFSIGKNGCVSCVANRSGRWFVCPDGVGGIQ